MCEVLASTFIVSVTTVTLAVAFGVIHNWDDQMVGPLEAVAMLLGFLECIVVALVMVGAFVIPSAFLVSILIACLKRWSFRAVSLLLLVVVICSLVSSYLIDPTQSREQSGSAGYFTRLDWFASEFNLTAVITGSVASLIGFWEALRRRKRYEPVA